MEGGRSLGEEVLAEVGVLGLAVDGEDDSAVDVVGGDQGLVGRLGVFGGDDGGPAGKPGLDEPGGGGGLIRNERLNGEDGVLGSQDVCAGPAGDVALGDNDLAGVGAGEEASGAGGNVEIGVEASGRGVGE